jgi:hypothetical protein
MPYLNIMYFSTFHILLHIRRELEAARLQSQEAQDELINEVKQKEEAKSQCKTLQIELTRSVHEASETNDDPNDVLDSLCVLCNEANSFDRPLGHQYFEYRTWLFY